MARYVTRRLGFLLLTLVVTSLLIFIIGVGGTSLWSYRTQFDSGRGQ